MARHNLTTNIRGAAITKIDVADAYTRDHNAKIFTVGLELITGGEVKHSTTWNLRITNTSSDAIVASSLSVSGFTISSIATTGGYNTLFAAYAPVAAAGGDWKGTILATLATLGCIPPGTLA